MEREIMGTEIESMSAIQTLTMARNLKLLYEQRQFFSLQNCIQDFFPVRLKKYDIYFIFLRKTNDFHPPCRLSSSSSLSFEQSLIAVDYNSYYL